MSTERKAMIVTLKDGEVIEQVDFIYGKNDKLELRFKDKYTMPRIVPTVDVQSIETEKE